MIGVLWESNELKRRSFLYMTAECFAPSLLWWQGLSQAGGQQGLSDLRTGLIEHVFRIWDCLDSKEWWTELTSKCSSSIPVPDVSISQYLMFEAPRRKAIFLENVFGLLTLASGCRKLLNYILKAPAKFQSSCIYSARLTCRLAKKEGSN